MKLRRRRTLSRVRRRRPVSRRRRLPRIKKRRIGLYLRRSKRSRSRSFRKNRYSKRATVLKALTAVPPTVLSYAWEGTYGTVSGQQAISTMPALDNYMDMHAMRIMVDPLSTSVSANVGSNTNVSSSYKAVSRRIFQKLVIKNQNNNELFLEVCLAKPRRDISAQVLSPYTNTGVFGTSATTGGVYGQPSQIAYDATTGQMTNNILTGAGNTAIPTSNVMCLDALCALIPSTDTNDIGLIDQAPGGANLYGNPVSSDANCTLTMFPILTTQCKLSKRRIVRLLPGQMLTLKLGRKKPRILDPAVYSNFPIAPGDGDASSRSAMRISYEKGRSKFWILRYWGASCVDSTNYGQSTLCETEFSVQGSIWHEGFAVEGTRGRRIATPINSPFLYPPQTAPAAAQMFGATVDNMVRT